LVFSCTLILALLISQYDFNRLKPAITRMVKEKTGRELVIQGPISLHLDFTPSLIVERAAFGNATWGSSRNMAEVERLELELSLLPLLKKRIQIKQAFLTGPKFLIETDRAGHSNLTLRGGQKVPSPGETAPSKLFLGRISVERGVFSYRNGESGKSWSVAVEHLKAIEKKERTEIEIRATYASEPVELKGWVGPMAALMSLEAPWPVDVKAKALDAEIRVNGHVHSFLVPEGLALKVKGSGRSLERIGNMLGRGQVPDLGPFRIEFDFSGGKEKTYGFSNLAFRTKAGSGRGALQLSSKDSAVELRGWLSWDRLDVSALLSKGERPPDAAARKGKIFSAEPFCLEALRGMRGEMDITVDRVILPHTAIGAFKATLSSSRNRFSAKPLKFRAGKGEVSGTLELGYGGETASVSAQAQADNVDLNLLLRERRTQGKAQAEIDLTARGDSIAALMGNLEGRVRFAVRGFEVENKYVKMLGSDFLTNLSQIFAPSSKTATKINCMVGGFHITDGLAQVTAMVADTDEMVVVCGGRLNLKEERPDLTISPYPKKGVVGLSLSFSEITRSFRLGGTFAEPSLSLDPLQTALTIGKAVGGIFLMGPAGAALAFAGQTAGDEDICLTAVEATKQPFREATGNAPRADADRGSCDGNSSSRSLGRSFERLVEGASSQPAAGVDVYGGLR